MFTLLKLHDKGNDPFIAILSLIISPIKNVPYEALRVGVIGPENGYCPTTWRNAYGPAKCSL